MAELITKDQVIDWFRCYGHMDKPIPYDVLVTDIQSMDPVDAANLQQNDNCAAIAQQWISVTERLPEVGGTYLVYTNRGSVYASHFYEKKVFRDDYVREPQWSQRGKMKVTHWMPLPEPPKEVPENETI